MTVTITGNNVFSLKERLDELTAQFTEKHGQLALEKIDAEETDAQAIIEAIKALPFLAQRKMVVIRNAGANKTIAGQIEQIISSIPETSDVVFLELITDKRSSYYKIIKSKTRLEEYNQFDAAGMAKWLVEQAKTRGGELKASDAIYLAERVGLNQMLLSNELDKLLTYDNQISRDNIDDLVELSPQSKIFDLLDAAFGGNKQKALRLYEEQRAQKVEPQAVMAMITWQLQLLALAKLGEGKSTSQIAKDSGTNPYPITKASRLAAKLEKSRLRDITGEALEIDWKSKISTLDLDEALKTYIATL
jgi:DNA polymerase-3 subunit delta